MARWALRCFLLAAGFALTTFGLMQWQAEGLELDGFWPFGKSIGEPFYTRGWLRPVHFLLFGVVTIAASLWDVFRIEPFDSNHDG